MKPARLLLTALTQSLMFIFSLSPVLAQSAPPEKPSTTMDEVVVMATRDRQEIRKIPANITVITAQDITDSGATNLAEVLTGLDGIYVRSTSGNAAQAAVDMRGFGENGFGRTVVTLDGRRLNRPDMASVNWLEIPLGEIERIEVARGAGSVLYGDAAIAGTINIVTKRGEGRPRGDVGLIVGNYNTNNERATALGSAGKFYFAVNGENLHTDGYRDRAKFTSSSAGTNLGYSFSDALDVSFGVTMNRTDNQLPGYLTQSELAQDRRQAQPGHPDDDARNDSLNTNLTIKSMLGDYGLVDVNLIYGARQVTTNWAGFLSFSQVNIDTAGVTPKYVLDRKIAGHDNKLIIGVDFYSDKLTKNAYADRQQTQKTSIADIKRQDASAYIHDDFNIIPDLILTLGARTERVTISGTQTAQPSGTTVFDSSKDHQGEAYEAALTYLFGEKSRVFAKWAQVFRIPFLDEQASFYGFGTDAFYTNLEKETGTSYEAGILFYPLKDLKLSVTFYRIDMQDEIKFVLDPITFTGQNVNLDRTRHEGVEIAAVYEMKKRFRLAANFTGQDVTFQAGPNSGKNVPLVPQNMANAVLEIYLPWDLTLRPEVHYVGPQYFGQDDDNSSPKLDGYTLFNLFLTWKPTIKDYRLMAFVGVENLGDQKYSTYGFENGFVPGGLVYYPAPEITVKGGMTFYLLGDRYMGDTYPGRRASSAVGLLLCALLWATLAGTATAAPPARIVSLAPNLTEILYDIGLGDHVVAVTDFCDYPPEVKKKPKIGGFSTPSLEAVVAVKPDMVVMTKDGNPPEFAERLKRIGIRIYVFEVRRIKELPRGIRELGAALDVAQTANRRADRIENLLRQYEAQARKNASSGIRSALFIVQPEPPIVAGPGTLIDDSFKLLGLRNIAAGASSEYPRYSIEMIIHGAPDVILMGSMGRGIPGGDTNTDPLARGLFSKLSSLEAVRNGRICYTSDAVFRLGPRIVDGIREIAACTGRL